MVAFQDTPVIEMKAEKEKAEAKEGERRKELLEEEGKEKDGSKLEEK